MTDSGKKQRGRGTETEAQPNEYDSPLIETPEQVRAQFGAYVAFVRKRIRNPKLSQAEAAKRAGISRETWNRIERGRQLPDPINIPAIAETLKANVVKLYRRARYEVPLDLQIDSRKKLTRDLLVCWDECTSAASFLFSVLGIWLRDKREDEKGRRIFLDRGFGQILLAIEQNLTRPQQLRLAAELIQRTPIKDMRKERIDACQLLEEIDSELDRIKRIEARSLGGLYEIRSLDGMGDYQLLITDKELTDFLSFIGTRTKE
jgi:transcriptional regulator with XRE-family HTH domain